MSLHALHRQGPGKPSSCPTITFSSHGGRAATDTHTHKSCIYACRVTLVVSNSLQPCRLGPAALLCLWDSPGNTGVYWPILVAITFQNAIFPAALATNSPEYLVLLGPPQTNQLHHLQNCPSQGKTQVLQGSLRSKPQWTTRMQKWKYNHT